jgi:hypothetical protein
MCYSTQASITAWIISVIIGIYLWKRDHKYDRWNAGFIWSFSAIQLWEAGIWSSSNNEIYLRLILITLMLQPLAQTFGAWKTTSSQFLEIMVGIYILLFLYTIYRSLTEHFSVSIGPSGHLIWDSNKGSFLSGEYPIISGLYLVGLILGLFWALPTSIPLIIIGISTMLWSLSKVSSREFGSYWCYISVLYSMVALLI